MRQASRTDDGDFYLQTRLLIASEPENRFNAMHLDGWLRGLTMPDRDAVWSVGLSRRFEWGGPDDPLHVLLEWATDAAGEEIEADRARLTAIALAWTFSTSHRQLRDRATKALSAFLAPRLSLAAELVEHFRELGDPYVVERVLCAAYGAGMLAPRSDGLERLAGTALNLLKPPSCPTHLLSRDYARGIVALAAYRGALPFGVHADDAAPPYGSRWPLERHSKEVIEGYVEEGKTGVYRDSIVQSTGEFGDFGRYIVSYRVGSFGVAPARADGHAPTHPELFHEWLEEFATRATGEQMKALGEYLHILIVAMDQGGPMKEELKGKAAALHETLKAEDRDTFREHGGPTAMECGVPGRPRSTAATFDLTWASRWICWRAHELGWTPERFSAFEQHFAPHQGRMDHRIERLGKKYQWIALHELLARLSDNVAFIDDAWADKGSRYVGPWQVGARDIDPSLVLRATHAMHTNPKCWWAAPRPPLPYLSPTERMAWIEHDGGLLNDPSLIEVADPSGRRWLVLDTFTEYRRAPRVGGRRHTQQETWYRVRCIVCRKSDTARLARALGGHSLTDPHSLPGHDSAYGQFLGEHPWHPAWSHIEDWMDLPRKFDPKSIRIRRPSIEYVAERGGYDYSFDDTMRFRLPNAWLLQALDARLANGSRPTYLGPDGRIVFLDPSIAEEGPSAALVDREAFLRMLERDGLAAVWIVAGEKNAYGRSGCSVGDFNFGGSRLHTGVYRHERGRLQGTLHSEKLMPSEGQRVAFLGEKSDAAEREPWNPAAGNT
ncbi:hypothetical protein [Roseomonas harenae]|uniref:hypothetical protein n=1 Tax=Muricoccus harenae TaxID=2692566 RepID=UPI0013318D79|nr:hypothetical protein [Roseomonas harenae]